MWILKESIKAFHRDINDLIVKTTDEKKRKKWSISTITKIYGDFVENEYSKIYNNDYFGYRKVTILQPEIDENGSIKRNSKGVPIIDKNLTETEIIPLNQSVEDYLESEVIPFNKNALIDESKTKIGYEILFMKYFYKYIEPENSKEILKEISELDKELDLILKGISYE